MNSPGIQEWGAAASPNYTQSKLLFSRQQPCLNLSMNSLDGHICFIDKYKSMGLLIFMAWLQQWSCVYIHTHNSRWYGNFIFVFSESVTPQMECQPRPHIVNQLEIKSKLNRQSSRLRTYHNYYNATVDQNSQISTCILLHRCGKHSGCCRNEHQECSPTPTSSQVVTIDVTVQMRVGNSNELKCSFDVKLDQIIPTKRSLKEY